jgi:two-component system NtrC family sensor kinase
MRIAIRLWIALLVTIVLVLGSGVLIRIQQEQRLLLEVTLRDRRFFAHVLQGALAQHPQVGDPLQEAQAMLRREEIAGAHIEARLVGLAVDSQLPRPRLPGVQIEGLKRGKVVVGAHEDELLTYVPLEAPGVAMELAEPHAVAELVARISWWSLWTQALALTALAGLVTLVLVRWLVGKPLGRLALLARQVGGGDLGARAPVPAGEDEVAVLAREMNGMAEGLERARRTLQELDAERVSALEQLRHADRLRTVGQLASALAHELGTPLNVISGHARLIEQEAVLDNVRESTSTIIEQTSRMASIIRELLGFARKRASASAVHELGALAEQAARTLEPLAQRSRVVIEVKHERPVHVHAAAQHVLQALTNLLTNAMHAMPQGGTVRVETSLREVVPPTGIHAKPGRYACIAVIDTGTGFDPDDLPHLFEPFFTRKSEGEGTGLGLAVVEGIAKEHRGWVSADSHPGRGSRFEIYLPSVSSEPPGNADNAAADASL